MRSYCFALLKYQRSAYFDSPPAKLSLRIRSAVMSRQMFLFGSSSVLSVEETIIKRR